MSSRSRPTRWPSPSIAPSRDVCAAASRPLHLWQTRAPSAAAVRLRNVGLHEFEDGPPGPCYCSARFSIIRPADGAATCLSRRSHPAALRADGADPSVPVLTELEHTLTDGYARALALEGERLRIERQDRRARARRREPGAGGRARELAGRCGARTTICRAFERPCSRSSAASKRRARSPARSPGRQNR